MKKRDIKRQLRLEASQFVPDNKEQIMRRLSIAPFSKYKSKLSRFSFKFSLVFTVFLVAIIGISLSLTKPVSASNSVITVDINPSIEIELDKENNVLDVRGLNVDGALVLEAFPNKNWSEQTYQFVLDNIIQISNNLGYIDSSNPEATINVSTTNKNQNKENEVANIFKAELEKSLATKTLNILVRDSRDNDEIREKAKENHVSIGKMSLIHRAMTADKSLTMDTALKLDPKQLNEIINEYNQEKIQEFKNKFNERKNSLDGIKDQIKLDFENRKKGMENSFKGIKRMIENESNSFQIEAQIRSLLKIYMPDYEFAPENEEDKYEYYEDVLDDIKDRIEDYYDELLDSIEDKIDEQSSNFNNYVRDRIKENQSDFNFDYEFDFNLDDIINEDNEDNDD